MALPLAAPPLLAPRPHLAELDAQLRLVLGASQHRLELLLRRHSGELAQAQQLLSGGVAGCVAKAAVAPLSRLTILMQVQSMRPHKFHDGVNPNNRGLVASFRKICREEGFASLWRGTGATLAHRFPYGCATFYANAALRQQLEQARWAGAVPERLRGLTAGAGSAFVAVALCHPLDIVKTRITAQTKTRYYANTLDAVLKIRRDEGFRGLYRGLGVSLCSTVPLIALNFGLYEHFSSLYGAVGSPQALHSLMAGGSSGAAASALLFPLDLVRRQMQMVGLGGRPGVYTNVFQAVRHVFLTGCGRHCGRVPRPLLGLREFYRGLAPELAKVTPYNAIMFCVHGRLQGGSPRPPERRRPPPPPGQPIGSSAGDQAAAPKGP